MAHSNPESRSAILNRIRAAQGRNAAPASGAIAAVDAHLTAHPQGPRPDSSWDPVERLREPVVFELLLAMSETDRFCSRFDAVLLLGCSGDPRALEPLLAAARDEADLVRLSEDRPVLHQVRAEESALPRSVELGITDSESPDYRRAAASASALMAATSSSLVTISSWMPTRPL